MSLGIDMVLMRCNLVEGLIGRLLMSSIDNWVLAALLFWMALRWALVVLRANPNVLKVVVSL